MADVAIHYPHMWAGPGGIWWEKDGRLLRHYTDPELETVGLSTMLPMVASADASSAFRRLSERAPYADTWETADVEEGTEPEELLTILQGQAKKLLRSA